MRAAYEEGVPIARIAREAGVSRPTAYDWLKRR
jgi:transposase-like protein